MIDGDNLDFLLKKHIQRVLAFHPWNTYDPSLNRKYKDYVYRKMLVQEYLKK